MEDKAEFRKIPLESEFSNTKFLNIASRIVLVQFVFIVILLSVIVILLPLKENIPYFVQFSTNKNNFVYVKKANRKLQSNINVTNQALASYIISRESINLYSQEDRRIFVKNYSTNNIYNAFLVGFKANHKAINNNYYRNIEIITTSTIQKNKTSLITIAIYEINRAKKTKIGIYRITIVYDYRDMKVSFKEANMNPLGLIVKNYNIERIGQ
jgi:type IV secretory pathway component VirB8